MQRIVLTNHARDRLKERNIDEQDAQMMLINADKVCISEKDFKFKQAMNHHREGMLRTYFKFDDIIFVVRERLDEWVLITVFKAEGRILQRYKS